MISFVHPAPLSLMLAHKDTQRANNKTLMKPAQVPASGSSCHSNKVESQTTEQRKPFKTQIGSIWTSADF